MTTQNNDRTVMAKPIAWRPIACLPILKAAACTVTCKEWQTRRRLEIYHRSMDHIIEELNAICNKTGFYRFADQKIRRGRPFLHILSMDGLEIAASTMCSTDNCPVCEVPKAELARTDVSYPLRRSREVEKEVKRARQTLLNEDGTIKDRCIGKVIHDIVYNFTCYIVFVIQYMI